MTNVSTKTGDKGQTGLANGDRISKSEPVFEAMGTLDELNSWLGLVIVKMESRYLDHKKFLLEIQNQLFVMGGELARADNCLFSDEVLKNIEKKTDSLQNKMSEKWHKKFLLPGGTELAAHLDIARTVCRRAERCLVDYSQNWKVRPMLLKSLNRFSDYLYVLRVFVNYSEQVKESEFRKL